MNNPFQTTDITIAAYLTCADFKLVRIDKQGMRGTFVFDNVNPEVITQFDLGKALVEPSEFHNAVKQLTSACRRS